MSGPDKLPDGTLIVSFEEAAEFLGKRAGNACPACGKSKWSIFTRVDRDDLPIGLGLVGVNLKDNGIMISGVPLLIATCDNCAYMRIHNLQIISKLVNDGKSGVDEIK